MRFVGLAFVGFVTAFCAACGGGADMPASMTGATSGAGGAATTVSSTTFTATASSTSSVMLDDGAPSDVHPAPHPGPPLVQNYGGPVLASPKIVPVFFSNDDPTFTAQLKDFDSKVGSTAYWAANTREYGVGAATATDPVDLTETATGTIDDTDIQAWLAGKLNSDDMAFPAPDANTVYVLHYPAGVTVTESGGQSCVDFGGYHGDFPLDANHGGIEVAYAVLPRCSEFPPLTGIDAATGPESHELLEAATDPYPMSAPAYATVDIGHIYWERVLGGSETGDMCAQFPAAFAKFPELGYTVQRTWSNQAAKAGHDPCVPALSNEVYFNAAPVQTDSVLASVLGQSVQVKGVKIPVGESKTIDVDLFSDSDTGGPWTVDVMDASAAFGGTAHLDLQLDRRTGQNGEKLHLTITVLSAGKHNNETFLVSSHLGTRENIWVGIVGN